MDVPSEYAASMLTKEAVASVSHQNMAAVEKADTSKLNPLWDLVFGSLAGMNGKIIEYPFDTVKVRMQTMDSKVFGGTIDCLKQTWVNEGFTGFYRGLASPLVGAMVENAFIFFAYKKIQSLVAYSTNAESNQALSVPQLALCGGISGLAVAFILTPVELIKCKLQVENVSNYAASSSSSAIDSASKQAAKSTKFNGPFSVIQSIIQKDGIKGMFKGFIPTISRECPGTALWFGTYEIICHKYLEHKNNILKASTDGVVARRLTKDDVGPGMLILAGGSAGIVYNFATFPIDVIKSRVQTMDVIGTSAQKNASIREIASGIYKSGGIPGFYRGLGVTLLRAFPANATMFLTFEYLSRLVTNLV
ncbi:hypothetical protein BB560_004663 [Smittium megazygosporum]|uniref:Uncharacterized protein n=1 Tax=Smittium megazygosporum TaxID=133381 RepID=A0A2T9Z8L3_9FUNG|nr:hypothetical protein BB560_004663 [Smittium megazygosporum]